MEADYSLMNTTKGLDKKALVVTFDHYAPELYNYALHLCRDPLEADNIVGDVFTKLLEQLAAGKGPKTNIRSYLYRMTYHLIIDRSRASRRFTPLEFAETTPDSSNGYHSMLAGLENKMVVEAVILAIKNDLTTDQRNVIILRFVEGFSVVQTAEIMGKGIDNVKVIQSRAITKLRKVLEQKVGA